MSGFSNPIAAGDGTLLVESIHSPDYAAGVDGWTINEDGSAEFNGVILRGELIASLLATRAAGRRIVIDGTGADYDKILFYSGEVDEVEPGSLGLASTGPGGAGLYMLGNRVSGGAADPTYISLTSGGIFGAELQVASAGILDISSAGRAAIGSLSGDTVLSCGAGATIQLVGEVLGVGRFFENTLPQNSVSTSLADAVGLVFSVEANARYRVEARLSYDGPTGTDFKAAWTGPVGFGMARNIMVPQLATADNENTAVTSIRRSAATAQQAGTPNSVANAFSVWWEDSLVSTGATAGDVQLQFARVGAAGTATLQAGSWLMVTRIA